MARIHGGDADFSLNSVAIEDELNSIDLEVQQDLQEVTAFADAAQVFVRGKYGFTEQVAGSYDGAASQGDATIFAMVGAAAAVATLYQPSGAGPATDDPEYQGSVWLESYRISSRVNAPVTYQATLRGTGALTRDVTP